MHINTIGHGWTFSAFLVCPNATKRHPQVSTGHIEKWTRHGNTMVAAVRVRRQTTTRWLRFDGDRQRAQPRASSGAGSSCGAGPGMQTSPRHILPDPAETIVSRARTLHTHLPRCLDQLRHDSIRRGDEGATLLAKVPGVAEVPEAVTPPHHERRARHVNVRIAAIDEAIIGRSPSRRARISWAALHVLAQQVDQLSSRSEGRHSATTHPQAGKVYARRS